MASFNTDTGDFGVDLDYVNGIPVLSISGALGWNAFQIASALLHKEFIGNGSRRVVVNLQTITQGQSNGVIPLIAVINDYRIQGKSVGIRLPEDVGLKNRFYNYNWAHHLNPRSIAPTQVQNTTSTGLMKFTDLEGMNAVAKRAMAVAIQAVTFAEGARQGLEWALSEVADNAVIHSDSKVCWLEARFRNEGGVSFNIVDTGLGIPGVLREAYNVASDEGALALAVEKGVTSGKGQGNGLAGTLNIVRSARGQLYINSGHGHLRFRDGRLTPAPNDIPFTGTYVAFALPGRTPVDLDTALWGTPVTTFAHYEFNAQDDSVITVAVAQRFQNLTTRGGGKEMLRILHNLRHEEAGRTLILDFSGIEVISSGFADEVFGTLFIERGAVGFANTLFFQNVSSSVANIINGVVLQRASRQYLTSVDASRSDDR